MPFTSIKTVFAQAALASPDEFSQWLKAWRIAAESGSQEPLLGFFSRERGVSEEQFLQQLGQTLGWPYLDLRSEEHTSELQSHHDLVCRLLLEKKKTKTN